MLGRTARKQDLSELVLSSFTQRVYVVIFWTLWGSIQRGAIFTQCLLIGFSFINQVLLISYCSVCCQGKESYCLRKMWAQILELQQNCLRSFTQYLTRQFTEEVYKNFTKDHTKSYLEISELFFSSNELSTLCHFYTSKTSNPHQKNNSGANLRYSSQ